MRGGNSRRDLAPRDSATDTRQKVVLVLRREGEGPRERDVQRQRGAEVARQQGGQAPPRAQRLPGGIYQRCEGVVLTFGGVPCSASAVRSVGQAGESGGCSLAVQGQKEMGWG